MKGDRPDTPDLTTGDGGVRSAPKLHSVVEVIPEELPSGEVRYWVKICRPGSKGLEEVRYPDLIARPVRIEEDQAIKNEAKAQFMKMERERVAKRTRPTKANPIVSAGDLHTDRPQTSPRACSGSGQEEAGRGKDVPVRQREWLSKLQAVQDEQTREPRPVLVQRHKADRWHPWSECVPSERISTNSTLVNEIVFDLDTEDWKIIREEGGKLLRYLDAESIPHLLAWSGGKGIHVHIFADLRGVELDEGVAASLEGRADYGVDVPRTIRQALFEHIINGSGIDRERAKLDPLKVNFSTARKGSMVRAFGCLRPHGEKYAGGVKTLMGSIPERRPEPGELPLRFPEVVPPWNVVPLSTMINDALREAVKGAGVEAFVPRAIEGPLSSVPCYSYLMSHGAPEGMRNKGAFCVSLFNLVHGRPIEEAREAVKAYSTACPHPSPELAREHYAVLEGAYKREYHGVSCRMIRQDFGERICDRSACPLCTKKPRQKTQADRLVELAEQGGRSEFFRDERGDPHAKVWVTDPKHVVPDHYEIMKVDSTTFRIWLSGEFYRVERKAARREAIKSAMDVVSARGIFSGEEHPLSLRIAEYDGAFWLDMCDDRWRAIRIASDGWQIVDEPPILFRRYKHMQSLEEPKSSDGQALLRLVSLANLSKVDREHLKIQLLTDLIPEIVQMGQYLSGAGGRGKTWIGRIEKLTIDPAIHLSNSMPKKIEDLELLLDHNYIVCIDNITYISDEVSDMLSCSITGDARRSRTLYTNDDESFKIYRRILRMNGIANAVRLSDLMDRLIYRYPPKIEKGAFIDDKDMITKVQSLRPFVLWELLDFLVKAINIRQRLTKPSWVPRMSGWYMWALAAAEAMGKEEGWFEETFRPYIERQDSEALDGDMLAIALRHISVEGFLGTSTDLWTKFGEPDFQDTCKVDTRDPSWPKSAKGMGKRLSMISSNLEAMRVFVQRDLTYSEAHTKFGKKIFKIPLGRIGGYVKQDRMIIITSEPLTPLNPTEQRPVNTEMEESTPDERRDKGVH